MDECKGMEGTDRERGTMNENGREGTWENDGAGTNGREGSMDKRERMDG